MTGRKIGPYLVALAITGILILLAYFVFFVPQATKVKNLQAQTAAAASSNATLQGKATVLSEKRANLASLTGQVDSLSKAFPATATQQDLIGAITAAGAASGVTITTLNPVKPVVGSQEKVDPATAQAAAKKAADAAAANAPATGTATAATPAAGAAATVDPSLSSIAIINLTIISSGTQDQLRAFLGLLENLQRPLSVTDMKIDAGKDGASTLTVSGRTFLTKPLTTPTVKVPAQAGAAAPSPSAAPSK